eukprot:TRINITY_DN11765_c0_g1_i2.p2 TRINITY_DN11765_c0_g1~~TRINITY_DN11765_c0_g1_i2.p2  ORF type:complete len:140 (+),score=0.18 TRINITY_DN11765_c0_g1_i2:182-601(+)
MPELSSGLAPSAGLLADLCHWLRLVPISNAVLCAPDIAHIRVRIDASGGNFIVTHFTALGTVGAHGDELATGPDLIVAVGAHAWAPLWRPVLAGGRWCPYSALIPCLLYTSDAADEEDSVDLGGRRIIKKKKKYNIRKT